MPPDPAERDIVEGLRDGRADAWRALYDAYARRVWQAVARQMSGDGTEVADVVQETFMSAARAARQFDPARGSIWMWLCGIARRQVALHYRVRRRRDRLRERIQAAAQTGWRTLCESDDSGPGETLARRELGGLVRAVLTELPLDYEMMLSAKYFDGQSDEELAREAQCSTVAIRSRLARARRAFRKAFGRRVTA